MLSVLLVEKAQQIEKLAKPIKDLAQGRSSISFVFMGNGVYGSLRPGKILPLVSH
jgi:hypothetical protein